MGCYLGRLMSQGALSLGQCGGGGARKDEGDGRRAPESAGVERSNTGFWR